MPRPPLGPLSSKNVIFALIGAILIGSSAAPTTLAARARSAPALSIPRMSMTMVCPLRGSLPSLYKEQRGCQGPRSRISEGFVAPARLRAIPLGAGVPQWYEPTPGLGGFHQSDGPEDGDGYDSPVAESQRLGGPQPVHRQVPDRRPLEQGEDNQGHPTQRVDRKTPPGHLKRAAVHRLEGVDEHDGDEGHGARPGPWTVLRRGPHVGAEDAGGQQCALEEDPPPEAPCHERLGGGAGGAGHPIGVGGGGGRG